MIRAAVGPKWPLCDLRPRALLPGDAFTACPAADPCLTDCSYFVARALLSPSFIEGYGLPVVEALALGEPVIASDIASHREIGGDRVRLIDPLDGPAWKAAIERAMDERTQASPYAPESWPDYFAAWTQSFEQLRQSPRDFDCQNLNSLVSASTRQPHAFGREGGH